MMSFHNVIFVMLFAFVSSSVEINDTTQSQQPCNSDIPNFAERFMKDASDIQRATNELMQDVISFIEFNKSSIQNPEQTFVLTNLAFGRPAYQSSTNQPFTTADKAVDGNADPNVYHGHCSHTDDSTPGSPNWLVVDLQDLYYVKFVVLTNGGNPACDVCPHRLDYFIVGLTNSFSPASNPPIRDTYSLCGQYPYQTPYGIKLTQWCNLPLIASRYVIIQQPVNGIGYMTICELEVYGEKA